MDQISPPMRIALAAALVFAALWFVALRPKPVETVDDPLPTVSEQDVENGSTGAPKSESTPIATPKADKAEPSKAAADQPAAKKAATPKSGPEAVLADVKAGRTVVLVFSRANGSTDDRAVRRALPHVDRHDGKVGVYSARMGDLPRYEAITKSVAVVTSPTVLVINRDKQAKAITGVSTTREIDQAVRSALAAKPAATK